MVIVHVRLGIVTASAQAESRLRANRGYQSHCHDPRSVLRAVYVSLTLVP